MIFFITVAAALKVSFSNLASPLYIKGIHPGSAQWLFWVHRRGFVMYWLKHAFFVSERFNIMIFPNRKRFLLKLLNAHLCIILIMYDYES